MRELQRREKLAPPSKSDAYVALHKALPSGSFDSQTVRTPTPKRNGHPGSPQLKASGPPSSLPLHIRELQQSFGQQERTNRDKRQGVCMHTQERALSYKPDQKIALLLPKSWK
jgi:hypothetical protein